MLDVFVLNRRVLMRALSKKKVCKIWLRIDREKPKKPISKVSVRYFSVRPSLRPSDLRSSWPGYSAYVGGKCYIPKCSPWSGGCQPGSGILNLQRKFWDMSSWKSIFYKVGPLWSTSQMCYSSTPKPAMKKIITDSDGASKNTPKAKFLGQNSKIFFFTFLALLELWVKPKTSCFLNLSHSLTI